MKEQSWKVRFLTEFIFRMIMSTDHHVFKEVNLSPSERSMHLRLFQTDLNADGHVRANDKGQ